MSREMCLTLSLLAFAGGAWARDTPARSTDRNNDDHTDLSAVQRESWFPARAASMLQRTSPTAARVRKSARFPNNSRGRPLWMYRFEEAGPRAPGSMRQRAR